MDTPIDIDAIIATASDSEISMRHNEAINILKPLLRRKLRKRLTLMQETQVIGFVAICYRKLGKYMEALSYAKQYVDLTEIGLEKYIKSTEKEVTEKEKGLSEKEKEVTEKEKIGKEITEKELLLNYKESKYPTLHFLALNELIADYAALNYRDLACETIARAEAVISNPKFPVEKEFQWSIHVTLGNLELCNQRPNVALIAYNKGKLILTELKDIRDTPEDSEDMLKDAEAILKDISTGRKVKSYIADLADVYNKMATCHKLLDRWNEGIDCYKEAILLTNPLAETDKVACIVYATSLSNLGYNYISLKQYEKAIPVLDEAYTVFQRMYGDMNDIVSQVKGNLVKARELALLDHRIDIVVDHDLRMCTTCEKISEETQICPACTRAWYCDEKCQTNDWENHKLDCNYCACCKITKSHTQLMPHCSKCKKVKYCSSECQKKHWAEHKKDCVSEKK